MALVDLGRQEPVVGAMSLTVLASVSTRCAAASLGCNRLLYSGGISRTLGRFPEEWHIADRRGQSDLIEIRSTFSSFR